MAGRIIDADGHVRERDEDLLEFLPGRYQDLMHDPTYSFFPAITGGTNALRDPKIHSPHSVDLDGKEWLVSAVLPLAFRRTVRKGTPRTQVRRTDGKPSLWTV